MAPGKDRARGRLIKNLGDNMDICESATAPRYAGAQYAFRGPMTRRPGRTSRGPRQGFPLEHAPYGLGAVRSGQRKAGVKACNEKVALLWRSPPA